MEFPHIIVSLAITLELVAYRLQLLSAFTGVRDPAVSVRMASKLLPVLLQTNTSPDWVEQMAQKAIAWTGSAATARSATAQVRSRHAPSREAQAQ